MHHTGHQARHGNQHKVHHRQAFNARELETAHKNETQNTAHE